MLKVAAVNIKSIKLLHNITTLMHCKQEKAAVNELRPPQTQYPLETTTHS